MGAFFSSAPVASLSDVLLILLLLFSFGQFRCNRGLFRCATLLPLIAQYIARPALARPDLFYKEEEFPQLHDAIASLWE